MHLQSSVFIECNEQVQLAVENNNKSLIVVINSTHPVCASYTSWQLHKETEYELCALGALPIDNYHVTAAAAKLPKTRVPAREHGGSVVAIIDDGYLLGLGPLE